jgi:hypothetical protein
MSDRRFGGLSALTIDHGRFVTVSDLGAAISFDPPSALQPMADIRSLVQGPGDPAFKRSRDAESLVRDPRGRGWWIGYEQRHSLWLYDDGFGAALARIALPGWPRNRGAEGLLTEGESLIVFRESGREAMWIGSKDMRRRMVDSNWDIADASRAPDGRAWVLLRSRGWGGIEGAIAPLIDGPRGYNIGEMWAVPKAPLDNYEGLAISRRPGGGWRFWLVTDDGHRVMARTLLVALDLPPDS